MLTIHSELGKLQGEAKREGEEVVSHLCPDLYIWKVQWPGKPQHDADTMSAPQRFQPLMTPGVQVDTTALYMEYIKEKPTKWGIKHFVLADSSNSYTADFSVYVLKSHINVLGLSYDSVMNLAKLADLVSGFHFYITITPAVSYLKIWKP